MGRYYNGDIEGKFVFGSQSSAAADRFGVAGHTPGYLEYYYDETNLDDLETELKNYVPDHYLFAEDAAEDEPEDNTDEPEPEQQEFDFGEIIKRRPN